MRVLHIAYLLPQMSDVKRLPERLDCLLFRARFKEELDELTPVSVTLHSSCNAFTLFTLYRAFLP